MSSTSFCGACPTCELLCPGKRKQEPSNPLTGLTTAWNGSERIHGPIHWATSRCCLNRWVVYRITAADPLHRLIKQDVWHARLAHVSCKCYHFRLGYLTIERVTWQTQLARCFQNLPPPATRRLAVIMQRVLMYNTIRTTGLCYREMDAMPLSPELYRKVEGGSEIGVQPCRTHCSMNKKCLSPKGGHC